MGAQVPALIAVVASFAALSCRGGAGNGNRDATGGEVSDAAQAIDVAPADVAASGGRGSGGAGSGGTGGAPGSGGSGGGGGPGSGGSGGGAGSGGTGGGPGSGGSGGRGGAPGSGGGMVVDAGLEDDAGRCGERLCRFGERCCATTCRACVAEGQACTAVVCLGDGGTPDAYPADCVPHYSGDFTFCGAIVGQPHTSHYYECSSSVLSPPCQHLGSLTTGGGTFCCPGASY